MRLAILTASILLATATPLYAQSVAQRGDDIVYTGKDGIARTLIKGGDNSDPVLSPDGRTVAFIHTDADKGRDASSSKPTSLWVADGLTGTTRKLFASRYGDSPQTNMESFGHPVFSLDGGFVYVSANDAWATSTAVHQISVATGTERFVIDGFASAVIRTGRWRGYLLVGRHKYWPAPKYGSYNPIDVVRPDAKQLFTVPGSDRDDGEESLPNWLEKNRWKAW